jgi:GrpB-like predicted nucleotidyltransferase (UPF0157 family)
MAETLEKKIQRVLREAVTISAYDPAWPEMFRREKEHLLKCLPSGSIRRIEHYGSTAVPGLAAKPIVDMLVEVTDLDETKTKIAPILEMQGYDYFWRPTSGDDVPPFYAWFIKRDRNTRYQVLLDKSWGSALSCVGVPQGAEPRMDVMSLLL